MANDITTLTTEQLVKQRQKANQALEEMEAARKILDEEIIRRLNEEKIDGTIVGEWSVKKIKGVRFNTPLDYARDLSATKVEEKVDTLKLRKLYQSGVKIEGASEFEYLRVSQME